MLNLEANHPEVYEQFKKGHFVVQRMQGKFNAVGVDMALEQTINRSRKSSGGIIGQQKGKSILLNGNSLIMRSSS